jgi:hypothetical protein
MIHLTSPRAVRCPSFVVLLLWIVSLVRAAGITFAAAAGDQVELKATHQAVVGENVTDGSRYAVRGKP